MSTIDASNPGIAADWAVRAKRPGRAMGYALLTGSGDRERAEGLIEAGVTGTPSDENVGRLDALPWLSFVADGTGEPVLGVVARSWSRDRDGTGQTIVPSRLLTVPWPRENEAGPGFLELGDLVVSIPWSSVDGPPKGTPDGTAVRVSVSPMDQALLATTIDEVGFDWVLSVAVALLDGKNIVIVIQPRRKDVEKLLQRVKLLDAVCALLPYGCRAWISAATWARDRSEHDVRLSFAASARPHQLAMPFSEGTASVTPTNPAAAEYYREMTVLRAKKTPTATIVAHLAAMRQPLSPQHVGFAVRHLQELRLPEAVYEEIRDGRGDPARVDRVLSSWEWRGLDEGFRKAYVCFLAEATQVSAADARRQRAKDTLKRHWQPELVADLADELARELRSGRQEGAQRHIAAAAVVNTQARDELVARVLQRVAPAAEPGLAKRTIDLLDVTNSLHPDNGPAWQVLASAPELGARLLSRSAASDTHFPELLANFQPREEMPGAEWLHPVRRLFVDNRIDLAATSLPDSVLRLLFDLAVAKRQVVPFLSVAWQYVLRNAYEANRDGSYPYVERIDSLVAAESVEPATVEAKASADLLSLGTNGRMPYLREDPPGFVPALATAWGSVPEVAREWLAERLPAAVLDGKLSVRSFEKLVAVTSVLDSDLLRRNAVIEVGQNLAYDPDVLRALLPFDEKWERDLTLYAPEYEWIFEYVSLGQLAQHMNTKASEIRDEYQRFREHSAPADVAVRAIAPWLQSHGAQGIVSLLWHSAKSTSGSSSDFSRDPYGREIHEAVLDGAAGPEVAASFKFYVADLSKASAALTELNEEVLRLPRRRRGQGPPAERAVTAQALQPREEPSGKIRRAGREVAGIFGFKDHRNA